MITSPFAVKLLFLRGLTVYVESALSTDQKLLMGVLLLLRTPTHRCYLALGPPRVPWCDGMPLDQLESWCHLALVQLQKPQALAANKQTHAPGELVAGLDYDPQSTSFRPARGGISSPSAYCS